MRYLKKYENRADIVSICQKYGIEKYTINDDGSMDVDGDVCLYGRGLTKLPLKFRNIEGYFYCDHNRLTSLEGCPKSMGGGFNCGYNKLMSLEGCPKSVGDYFYCGYNEIETFEGLDFVNICDDFYCSGNPIFNVWLLFWDHTKFEFFNDCDIIREDRVIILNRLNFFLDYINEPTVTEVDGYRCI